MNLLDAIKVAFIGKQRKPSKGEIVDIYGNPVKDALEYFYPKQITGIPVFSVDSIYNHYNELIKEVKKNSGIGEHREVDGVKTLDFLFSEVIKRYIEYIHMLPASENHHHSTPGGMIVHSLEASAHAQKFAKENKPESLGMQDLDRQSLPTYRYAAWLATFMHDAGKVLRDIVVDAVDVKVQGSNKYVKVNSASHIPSWRPQKESLVSWAKRFGVASYSVTYVKDRVHNQHNVDSVQLLDPVLGKDSALEFLLDCPADVHSKLVRVLAGHDNGKDYIASSVRRGDMLSTSRNVAKSAGNTYLTEQSLSAPAKIYKAMKIAKKDWTYNTLNADVWVVGGEVYLRYSKTFHSIIKAANKNDLVIPNDLHVVTMLMEESGITQAFDSKHKSVKFIQGQYSDKQLEGILKGTEVVTWMELIRVQWKGLLFGDEPMPDSECGIFYMPENRELIEVNEMGEFKPFSVESAYANNQTNSELDDNAPPQGELPPLPTEEDMGGHGQSIQPATPSVKTTSTKPNHKKLIEEAKASPKKPKPKLNFKNKPEVQNDEKASNPPEQSAKPEPKLDTPTVSKIQGKAKTQVEDSQAESTAKNSKTEVEIKPIESTETADAKPEAIKKNPVKIPVKPSNNEQATPVAIEDMTKHVKLFTTKQRKGAFVAIEDVIKYLQVEDKVAVMKMLVESGVARLDNGNPVVLLEVVNDKKQQIIEVNVSVITPSKAAINSQSEPDTETPPASKKPRRRRNKTKQADGGDSQAPTQIVEQEAKQVSESEAKASPGDTQAETHLLPEDTDLGEVIKSAQDSNDEQVDYGLLMRVKNAREGTLAHYIGLVFESYPDNSDKRDFVIERQGKIAINATRLIEQVKTSNPDKPFQLRHLLKSCKSGNASVDRVQIDGMNFIELASDTIQDIDIEV